MLHLESACRDTNITKCKSSFSVPELHRKLFEAVSNRPASKTSLDKSFRQIVLFNPIVGSETNPKYFLFNFDLASTLIPNVSSQKPCCSSSTIDSKNDEDIINGLYVLEYMIKISEKKHQADSSFVLDNIREMFAPQLIKLIYPRSQMRISQDSLRLLKIVIEESILSKYASEALRIAIEQITNDNEYQNYIQIYVWHFENTSKQNKKALCDSMYALTLKEGKIAERALNLYSYFIKSV